MYVCLRVQSAGLGLGDELEQVNPHCAIADQLEVDGLTEKEREEFGYVWREVCACLCSSSGGPVCVCVCVCACVCLLTLTLSELLVAVREVLYIFHWVSVRYD